MTRRQKEELIKIGVAVLILIAIIYFKWMWWQECRSIHSFWFCLSWK
jgi:hypothetical protein